MRYERLEITRRAANGDIYRRITCLAGRVTVFRGRGDDEVELYDRVLRCEEEHERFAVLLDSKPFTREDQIRVGAGEDPLAGESGSLFDFLIRCAIPSEQVPTRLEEVGLGGLELAMISDLTAQQRCVLLLVSISNRSDKVMVLHDPFDGIPSPYADALARRFAEGVWRNSAIAIVTKLTVRPDAWVENEHIARVQLERPRDRTIGFGGGELSSSEFIQAFREQLRQADTVSIAPEKRKLLVESVGVRIAPPSTSASRTTAAGRLSPRERARGILTAVAPAKRRLRELAEWRYAAVAAGGGVAALLCLFLFARGGAPSSPPAMPVMPAPSAVRHHRPRVETVRAPIADVSAPVPAPATPALPPSVLDAYPPAIHQIVMKAFYEPQSVLKDLPTVSYSQPQRAKAEAPSPLPPSVPAMGDAPAEAPPVDEPPPVPAFNASTPRTQEEMQAQRELLRRAFVDAVMRARERQMQMQYGSDSPYPQ